MLCKICRHCGLCQGDGKIQQNNLSVEAGISFCQPLALDKDAMSYPETSYGIAVDVGTTTVVATAWSFAEKRQLCQVSQPNGQRIFGADVISRLSFATGDDGYEKLHEAILLQLEKIIIQLNMEISSMFLSRRLGRPELRRLVVTGNTVMLSFVRGVSVAGLCTFPFTCQSLFGETVNSSQVFVNASAERLQPSWSQIMSTDFKVIFAPCVSAFVGGDAVCAMLSSGFFLHDGKERYLADVGTNCEMAAVSSKGNIFCTSSSAGPAFEGHGISCGMAASEGAVVSVEYEEGTFQTKVIGGGQPEGLCGTGLLSAMAEFFRKGFVNENGTYSEGTKKICLSEKVSLTQKDVRNFQLAKAAVYSGLRYLEREIVSDEGEPVGGSDRTPFLYLCGGFGTRLNTEDAADTRMIPSFLTGNVVSSGNGALAGAVMILLDMGNLALCCEEAGKAHYIDLALAPDFQTSFISALNF